MRRVGALTGVLGLFVVLMLFVAPQRAVACGYERPPELAAAIRTADAVFVGRIETEAVYFDDKGVPRHGHIVKVVRVHAGEVRERELFTTELNHGCGGGPLDGGKRLYLVEGDRSRPMAFVTSGSRRADLAEVVFQTGPGRAPSAGASPEVVMFEQGVARRAWTVGVAAATVGLLLGAELGWRVLGRRTPVGAI